MKILYIGVDDIGSTSLHRANALARNGHEVQILNPKRVMGRGISNSILSKINYHTGYRLLQAKMLKYLKNYLNSRNNFDVIWVNGGELLGGKCIQLFNSLHIPVLLYNNDDPTGGRDGNRFDSLKKAIPYYDMCVVMREPNVAEYYRLGAKKVLRVTMSYDEIAHAPLTSDIPESMQSEVAFIGTWMRNESRDEFLFKLINLGVPISIWGNRWDKSPLWSKLQPYFRGGILKGDDYVKGIQGAKICLGLLSKGNRDEHTTRTMEVPFIGSLLCAERTGEHTKFFKENHEAVFWDDVEECAKLCLNLLSNDTRRKEIASNGRKRILSNEFGNQNIVKRILDEFLPLCNLK